MGQLLPMPASRQRTGTNYTTAEWFITCRSALWCKQHVPKQGSPRLAQLHRHKHAQD